MLLNKQNFKFLKNTKPTEYDNFIVSLVRHITREIVICTFFPDSLKQIKPIIIVPILKNAYSLKLDNLRQLAMCFVFSEIFENNLNYTIKLLTNYMNSIN